ncbi:hypothetical protein QJQ45_016563 [Haematococcus lacustris]|nr:hypothetical protein QJQ45_016563 [Haematococcus lacustris]
MQTGGHYADWRPLTETMLKQLNNDSVLRMNAEGMSGRAKLAMEDTTAWVADGVVTQQGMVAATAERKALQNHGATASPGGTAAIPGGTAASPGGTAAIPGGTAASPGGTAAIPGGTAASPGGTAAILGAQLPALVAQLPALVALATNKARLGKRQQQAQSKAERVMKRIRCLVSMPSDEQRAAAVAVRDSVTARQQQQQVDSKRLKELEDTARGVYNRFEPPLPALRSKGMTVEELKHLSQKLGTGGHYADWRPLTETMLKQLNNDSVLRMNAEGMSGRAKLAMEDTTAWVADGVVTQQGMVAATAERKALQNHGATASPGGTAAIPGGTAASPGGTAAIPGGTAASPGGTAAIPGGTAASPGGTAAILGAQLPALVAQLPALVALATNKARLGKRQQQAQSKAERVMKRIRCLVSMPSDEQRAAAVAVRDSVTARQQQQQVDSKRLKELEDTARGVYNRFEPPLPALRSKGMTVEELKHLSQKLGVGSVGKNRRQLLERIAEYCKQ